MINKDIICIPCKRAPEMKFEVVEKDRSLKTFIEMYIDCSRKFKLVLSNIIYGDMPDADTATAIWNGYAKEIPNKYLQKDVLCIYPLLFDTLNIVIEK